MPFKNFGSLPPIIPPSVLDNILHATTANFAAQVTAATPGTTILLASGNYGNWVGTNKAITIAPEVNADVTITLDLNAGQGGWTMDGGHTELLTSTNGPARTQDPPFTSHGITITEMFFQGTSNPPQNITIKRCWFTGTLRFDTDPVNLNANWTIDRCVWIDVGVFQSPDLSIPEACFQVWGNNITLKNCLWYACLADGVKLSGGTNVTVQDSEFWKMTSLIQPTVHEDAMQWNGSTGTSVIRNWFHDFEQACSAFDGTASNTILDNVVDSSGMVGHTPLWWIVMGGDNPASTVKYNTVIGGEIACGSKPAGPTSISIIQNNIGTVDLTGIAGGPNGVPTTNSFNMFSGAGSPNINGTPTFVGGTPPFTTYQAYKLTGGSNGVNASSDGINVGARIV